MTCNKMLKLCVVAIMAVMSSLLMSSATAGFINYTGEHLLKHQHGAVLHFYLHDNVIKNATAFTAAPPIPTSILPSANTTFFGAIEMIDDRITLGAELESQEIGRAQGMYIFCGLDGSGSLEFVWTLVFNEASGLKGSTITVKGSDRFTDGVREVAIVGGTGLFRLARGWLTITTVSFVVQSSPGPGDAVLDVNGQVFYGF